MFIILILRTEIKLISWKDTQLLYLQTLFELVSEMLKPLKSDGKTAVTEEAIYCSVIVAVFNSATVYLSLSAPVIKQ